MCASNSEANVSRGSLVSCRYTNLHVFPAQFSIPPTASPTGSHLSYFCLHLWWRPRWASVIGIPVLSEPMRRLPLAEQGRQHPYLDFHGNQTRGWWAGRDGDSSTLLPLMICASFEIITALFLSPFSPFAGLFQPCARVLTFGRHKHYFI